MSHIRALIDLDAFRHNLKTVKDTVGPNVALLPILKADAYGHGVIPLAREALKNGVKMIGLGTVEEGIELRKAKIASPLVLLDGFLPEEIPSLIRNRLTPAVHSVASAKALNRAAAAEEIKLDIHLKFDTGMGRLGILASEAKDAMKKIMAMKNLNIDGLMTHLASSQDTGSPQSDFQFDRFDRIVAMAEKAGLRPRWIHAANSGGILNYSRGHYNMVRPGIMLYGISPLADKGKKVGLHPVMTLVSRLVSIKTLPAGEGVGYNATYITPRNKRVGVVMGGYADGVKRLLSNRGSVLWKKKLLPVVGNICMDNFMVDLSRAPEAKEGDEVILLGPQHEDISVEKWAEIATTIPYEIFCDIGKRVERVIK